MAFTIGLSGLLTATGSTDLAFLIGTATKPYQANIDVVAENFDHTGFATTAPVAMSKVQGMASWTGGFSGYFPKASPASGHEGLVTFANGYVLGCRAWSLTAAATIFTDAASFASTPPSWAEATAGLYGFNGYFDVRVDDTTPLTGMTSGSASFRLSKESTNDNVLAGSIQITNRSSPFEVNGFPLVRYSYVVDGNLTVDGDSPLFAVAAAGTPDPLVRPSSTAITLRADGDVDYTGNALLSGWTVGATMGSVNTVQASFQGTGELTDGS